MLKMSGRRASGTRWLALLAAAASVLIAFSCGHDAEPTAPSGPIVDEGKQIFHNGIASTLEAVVELYDTRQGLHLTAQQKADLAQYLRSL